jgi:hypothetical protein
MGNRSWAAMVVLVATVAGPSSALAHPVFPPCIFGSCVLRASLGMSLNSPVQRDVPATLVCSPELQLGGGINFFDGDLVIGLELTLFSITPDSIGAVVSLAVDWIPALQQGGLSFLMRFAFGGLFYRGVLDDRAFVTEGARAAIEGGILWMENGVDDSGRRDSTFPAAGLGATVGAQATWVLTDRGCDMEPECDAVAFGPVLRGHVIGFF